jgi:hypothetical protein
VTPASDDKDSPAVPQWKFEKVAFKASLDLTMGDSFPETNVLDEFLMKSSGLLNTFAPIFSEAVAKTRNSYPFG